MSQHLPTHGFKWLDSEELSKIVVEDIGDEDEDGYFFEVYESTVYYLLDINILMHNFLIFFCLYFFLGGP